MQRVLTSALISLAPSSDHASDPSGGMRPLIRSSCSALKENGSVTVGPRFKHLLKLFDENTRRRRHLQALGHWG